MDAFPQLDGDPCLKPVEPVTRIFKLVPTSLLSVSALGHTLNKVESPPLRKKQNKNPEVLPKPCLLYIIRL